MANVTNLSVKVSPPHQIGIGYGKCALLYVGGVFDRSEFFTVGPALTFALKSEEQATAGGQILVSETAFRFVRNQYYVGEELVNEEGQKFFRVASVIQGIRGRADAVLLKSQMNLSKFEGLHKSLKSCVPAAIIPYLEVGLE
jgi:class 3 adenylate cyclase